MTLTAAATHTALFADLWREQQRGLQSQPAWLKQFREKSYEVFLAKGFPTTAHEAWRYTSLAPLLETTYAASTTLAHDLDALKTLVNKHTKADWLTLVFIEGAYCSELSTLPNELARGVHIAPLSLQLKNNPEWLKTQILADGQLQETDALLALNDALSSDGVFLRLEPKTVLEQPVHLLHIAGCSGRNYAPLRTIIRIGQAAQATFVETFIGGTTHGTFTHSVTDLHAEPDAHLTYIKSLAEEHSGFCVSHTQGIIERGATVSTHCFNLSGRTSRNNLDLKLSGEGCFAGLGGLSVAGDGQHPDHHTYIEHCSPNCGSNQLYKAVLYGKAKGVFNGKIKVDSIAQKTNAYQLNKSLLLSKDSEMNAKPELEIFADDVKCTHGATIGQLSPTELFYLRTRAIGVGDATRLLCRGFADEIVGRLPTADLRAHVGQLLSARHAQLGL